MKNLITFFRKFKLFPIAFLISTLFLTSNILAQNTGLKDPTTNAAVAGGGFTNPTNAYTSDNIYATVVNGDSHRYGGFNFTIPAGVLIVGIDVQVEGNRSGTTNGRSLNVSLSWNGGTNYTSTGNTGSLTGTDVVYTVGSTTDTWGRGWVASELSNANFQVRLDWANGSSGQINLDHVQARVYYTVPTSPFAFNSSGTFPVPAGVNCMKVEAWGAGGNGGNGTYGSFSSSGPGGAGGGSGAYVIQSSFTTTPGANLTVTVGQGGGTTGSGSTPTANTSVGLIVAAGGSSGSTTAAGAGGTIANSGGGTVTGGVNGSPNSGSSGGNGGTAPSGGTGGTGASLGNNGVDGSSPGGAAGGGGGGGGFTGNGNGGSGANGAVKLTWVDVSNFSTSATSPICAGTSTTVTLSSTSIAAGTYNVNYTTTNPANTTNVSVNFTGTTTKTGSFTISGLTGATSVITINSVGFTSTCGSAPQSNNTSNVTVNAPTATVSNKTNISCFGANDGTITVSASGGTSPYTFSIDNGATFQVATGTNLRQFVGLLANAAYQIKVKDTNGCISN